MKINIVEFFLLAIAMRIASSSVIKDRPRAHTDLEQLPPSPEASWLQNIEVKTTHNKTDTMRPKASRLAQINSKHVFGVDLPKDKTGWVEKGEAFFWWRKPSYTGVNPKTGKKREHLKECLHKQPHKIPDDAECCRNDVFWCWCRTYKKIDKRDAVEPLRSIERRAPSPEPAIIDSEDIPLDKGQLN